MLHPVRSSSPPRPIGQLADPASNPSPTTSPPDTPTTPISADPAPADRPFVFENLPAELIREVGGYVFRASAHQPDPSVDALAGNTPLRSALSAELRASQVVRDIHAARDMPGLLAAMDAIHQVLPNYRQGCIEAVLHLMPRIGPLSALPPAFWAQLQALLPTLRPASESDPDGTDPRSAVLLELTRVLQRHSVHSVFHLERALALVGDRTPVDPALAQALLRWSADLLGLPMPTGVFSEELRNRLMAAAPAGLQQQMAGLCRFSNLLTTASPKNRPPRMTEAMADVPAADWPHYLRVGIEDWGFHAEFNTRTRAFYEKLFQSIEAPQQLALLQAGATALTPENIERFLLTKVGQVPATTLARVCQTQTMPGLSPVKVRLIRHLVQASVGTPHLAEILHRVADHHVAHDPEMRAFVAEHAALTNDEDRQAIALRLDLRKVGCGERPASPGAGLLAMSARVDDMLEGRSPAPPAVVQTLADMKVGWLDLRQRSLLLDRIRALPAADCARSLTKLVDDISSLQPADRPELTRQAIAACAGLPRQYQATPLARLLKILRKIEPERGPLSLAASRLFHALPVGLRPIFDRAQQAALLPQDA